MSQAEVGAAPRAGVLGGGALGLAAARHLAQAGWKVTIIERENYLGGLAGGFRVGPNWLEKFYHHIFTTDTTIIAAIRDLGLGERLIWGRPNTTTLDHGRFYSLGGIADLFRLRLLSPPDRLRLMAGMAVLKAIPNERAFVGQRAAPWMRRLMGPSVYRAMWEPVLIGKFGQRSDEIAMSWLWSRVHERSLRLGYLRGGFQLLYDALGERIQSLGGTLLTGTAATHVSASDVSVTVQTDAGPFTFDRLLVTLPTRLFAQLADGPADEYVRRFPGPDHYGAHVLILGLDRGLLPDNIYWLNINDRDLPFLAVVEHTNLMPAADYGGLRLVYLGNYLPMDHPLFGMDEEQVKGLFYPAIRRLRPDFDPAWVRQSWLFRAPYAQPIVTTDYLSTLPPHQTPLPGVYLANMAHVYPQDRGQNYSLRLGERLARQMLDDYRGAPH